MRTSKFTKAQIIDVLRQYDEGAKQSDLAEKYNVSSSCILNWRTKYWDEYKASLEEVEAEQVSDEQQRIEELENTIEAVKKHNEGIREDLRKAQEQAIKAKSLYANALIELEFMRNGLEGL